MDDQSDTSPRRPDFRDLTHRAVWTAVEAFLAVLLAVALTDATSLTSLDASALDAAVVGMFGAVATVVKEFARAQLQE